MLRSLEYDRESSMRAVKDQSQKTPTRPRHIFCVYFITGSFRFVTCYAHLQCFSRSIIAQLLPKDYGLNCTSNTLALNHSSYNRYYFTPKFIVSNVCLNRAVSALRRESITYQRDDDS